MLRSFNWGDFISLLHGAGWTILLCLAAGVAGIVFGLVLGIAASSPSRIARLVASAYVLLIRGIPLLVIVFFAYFGIPLMFPSVDLPAFLTAVIALTLFATAYMAEIFRGSINAVPRGQTEAAQALGLNYGHRLRCVILPQALRIAVPPGIGFLIALIKDSSLVTVIGFVELTRSGQIVSNLTAEPIITYLVVAALYFVVCYGVSRLGAWYENRSDSRKESLDTDKQPAALQLEGV